DAWSGWVPVLKNTVIFPDPEVVADDRMYVILGRPLIASSMGRSTAPATVSALAPGQEVETVTLGGAISGNRLMGSCHMDTHPRITSHVEMTVANTGLLMNVLSIAVVSKIRVAHANQTRNGSARAMKSI